MAKTIRIDELNVLETLETYFGEMALAQNEIRERIDTGMKLYKLVSHVLDMAKMQSKLQDEIEEDYLIEFASKEYADIFWSDGNVDEVLMACMHDNIEKYVKTTIENIAIDYYTSSQRAVEIAKTETNDYMNYLRHEEHVRMGYKTKRWDSLKDERVRHTHIVADGQEVGINEPFKVGMYEMMFPLDGSLGAGAEEIVNCRCVALYSK